MHSQILSGLNPEQLRAVTLPHQSALVIAGAGSGKTRVLTTRIAYLIQSEQVSPQGILAVTFTNKAAKEMLARISAMLPINTRGMWVGTFHGLCNRLLRLHYSDAGLPQLFQIMDNADQLAAIKRVMRGLNVDDEKYPSRQVQSFINNYKEQGVRASGVEIWDEFSRRVADVYAAYEEQCNRDGVVDFAELLLRCYELLTRNEVLRDHYRSRFNHILIDEFQDTNRLQYQWLKLLAGKKSAVFAVGDDDQSIYAFRGANSANMREFTRDFNIASPIKLEQNYRSQGNILEAANALIRHNSGRLGKNLWTSEGSGEPLRMFEALNDSEEADLIVDEVRALQAEGIQLSDVALLYRSNAQSRVLEHALFTASIPYRVYGGMRFFERQEIKHAMAYLRLINNPDDDGALLRVVNFPARGIGIRTLEQVQEEARLKGVTLWQVMLERAGGHGKLEATVDSSGGRLVKGVEGFVRLIEFMRNACQGLQLPEITEQALNMSGLIEHYRREREGAERIENLNELINAAETFIHERERDESFTSNNFEGSDDNLGVSSLMEFPDLSAFLAHAALEAGEHQAATGADALQLMTVHSAKGLEFHSVFISGLEEGLFPHDNSLSEADGLAEERRLMYVALTRARRNIFLSFAQARMLHGQMRYNVASRFLKEIPGSLIKKLNNRNEPRFGTGSSWAKASYKQVRHGTNKLGESVPTPALIPKDTIWHIGQNVIHPRFGQGIIVNCEGIGSDARVQVNFQGSGVKWLALQYAKLESF